MLRTPTIYTMPTFIDQFQIRLLICKFCGVAIQSISCSVLTCLTMSKHRLYTFPKALKHQSKQPVITWKLQSIEASKIVQIHQSWKTIAIYGNYDIFKKYFQMCSFIWWNNLINMSMGCGAMIKSKIAKFCNCNTFFPHCIRYLTLLIANYGGGMLQSRLSYILFSLKGL